MTHFADPLRFARTLLAAAACVVLTGGCSSVITSAYLREAWLDTLERATDGTDADEDVPAASRTRRRVPVAGDDEAADPPAAPLSLAEAVSAAETRLADAGGLSEAARVTLVAMLESTPTQDWPVVVEEFAAALAAGSTAAEPASEKPVGAPLAKPSASSREDVAPDSVAGQPTAFPPAPASPPAPATAPDPVPARAAAPEQPAPPSAAASGASPASVAAVIEPAAASAAPPTDQPAVAPTAGTPPAAASPQLSIVNACFASRVRAWGVVDRFESSRFRAGQQVILYFEIDNLSSRQSADGHSTRVDTRLVLLAADGTRLHEWTFDPLEETCLSKRRDYFARYVLELPAGLPPGHCRLEVAVEDALAGRTAATTLPVEIAGR